MAKTSLSSVVEDNSRPCVNTTSTGNLLSLSFCYVRHGYISLILPNMIPAFVLTMKSIPQNPKRFSVVNPFSLFVIIVTLKWILALGSVINCLVTGEMEA